MEKLFLQRLRLAKGLNEFHEPFYNKLIDCQYKYTYQAFNERDRFVFIDFYIPSEIFFAMDLIPVMSEHSVNFLASMGMVDDLLTQGNVYLSDSGTCSFHKPLISAFQKGLFPKAKLFATTTLCGESAKCFSLVANLLNSNHFCIDIPYTIDDKSIAYIKGQYIELVSFIEKLTGKKMDIDKFKECVKKSNVMRDYLVKGNDVRKTNVFLLGNQMLRFGGSFCYHGTDEAIDIAKSYYELLIQRKNNKEYKERYRILWTHLRPFYENDFFNYMEDDLHMAIAFEEANDVFWRKLDENDPYMAMAEKTVDWLYTGNINKRINRLKEIVKDFHIDGVINFAHVNCRVLNPKQYLIKKAFIQSGIPMLELSGDCIDRHNFSENQLLTRIEAFAELISK